MDFLLTGINFLFESGGNTFQKNHKYIKVDIRQ